MPAPREILELVARFEQQLDAYKSGQYNETQVRREFLDPFFKVLGWDIDNVQGFAEAYKDVIHEDQIRIAGATKAPDYCFRIGGTRKYFLEAKKPSVDIKQDISPAYQLRRYAWSAKLPLSVLSDFEEFAIYDGRVKPHKDDSASTARIFYCTFRDYAGKWDWIYERFSRDAVLKGAFDKFAETTKTKRGTTEVDAAFLEEIERWRKELAQNLALRNARLSQRELNFAVQRIIDRIIFLRICEDRGIEDYGRLRALVNGDRIYPRLAKLFEQADDRYNSGLFHFKKEPGRHEAPDELTLDLDLDDKLLRDILRGLYYPDSPYEFSVLSADILGQVYEQFLGKVIRLTDGHRAVVDDKPEVKKAGGVYYTPTYIVDYIVRQTVGKLLEEIAPKAVGSTGHWPVPSGDPPGGTGRTPACNTAAAGSTSVSAIPVGGSPTGTGGSPVLPNARAATAILNRVAKLRILDPACGSGSFLIGAYQFLLDWHLQFYLANDPVKFAKGNRPALVQTGAGWKLTIAERKRILLAHIYGVDIDTQAVEVTKLSLLLKVLEGETGQTLQTIFRLFAERALPDLGDNIKCGNSLIGPDFYQQAELPLLTDEERYRINVFDWQAEFPEIFRRRRGDESQTSSEGKIRDSSRRLLQSGEEGGGFDAVIGNPPYGIPFSELELSHLIQKFPTTRKYPDSYCIFMVQAMRLLKLGGQHSFIVPNTFCDLENCDDFRRMLLEDWTVQQIWQTGWAFKDAVVDTLVFVACNQKPSKGHAIQIQVDKRQFNRRTADFLNQELLKIDYRNAEEDRVLLDKASKLSVPLSKIATVKAGVKMYEKGKGTPPQSQKTMLERPFSTEEVCPKGWRPLFRGDDITRFRLGKPKEFVNYGPWLAAPRSPELFASPKIIMRRTDDRLLSSLEVASAICVNSCHVIKLNEANVRCEYVLGLVNSKLMQRVFEVQNPQMIGKVFAEIKVIYVERLPIRAINFSDKSDKAAHDRMVKLVEQMLELHRQLAAARTPQEKIALERQIAATDTQIDRLVYDLYGLTADEIKIVEGKADAVPVTEEDTKSKHGKMAKGFYSQKSPPLPANESPPGAEAATAAFYNIVGKEEGPPYKTEGEQP